MHWLRSVRVQVVALVVVLAALPFLVLLVMGKADAERRALVLEAVSEASAAIGTGLANELETLTPADIERLPRALGRFAGMDRNIRVLLRPSGDAKGSFFLLAAEPPLLPDGIDTERRALIDMGVLASAAKACEAPRGPPQLLKQKGTEAVTAVVSVAGQAGCWTVVISTSETWLHSLAGPRPYWQQPEAKAALAIYVLAAGLIALIFTGVWMALRRMQRLACGEHSRPYFARSVGVPELSALARAFDAMVDRLRRSAEVLHQAAEDNAHEFKGRIGTVRHALEPFRRLPEAATAFKPVDTALERLDDLVQSARLIESEVAEMLAPEQEDVDLSALAATLVGSYASGYGPHVDCAISAGVVVRGRAGALETVVENLVENAVSFASPEGRVDVSLARDGNEAVLRIEDDGPGVDPSRLPHIFERYYSHRPGRPKGLHFGIGLWLVRQHVLAIGGKVAARNRDPHGLSMEVRVPAV